MEKIINYLQNFVFNVHLHFGYFLAVSFWRKIVLPLATGNFSIFLLIKKNKDCMLFIKQNSNEGSYCPFQGPLFKSSLDKIEGGGESKDQTLKLIFQKKFPQNIIRKMNGRPGLVSSTSKKKNICLPLLNTISEKKRRKNGDFLGKKKYTVFTAYFKTKFPALSFKRKQLFSSSGSASNLP